ncbi:MAG: 1-deoxy-D-xylulose-5-phosphate reductoisomerase [Fusobacteria bacterium]|nr:1-deoxy-D-xylulose-5-phosphate reductoisomerase [Fusobacteriota bacterium]
MKNIAIIGSTGSIGRNALDILSSLKGYKIIALGAHSNIALLQTQIEKFHPKYVSIGTEEGYKILKSKFPKIQILFGNEGLKTIGALDETDIILTAISGAVGIEATVEAIKKGKRIALANKETMVAAGPIIQKLLKEYPKAEIIPVDSEHSALFQALHSGTPREIKNLILTASGGPFRGKSTDFLKHVSVEQALKHPNWSMGSKITIDSASLVNKGLEVIEAHFLFNVDYDQIKVVVHPESIVHSIVEFCDNSMIAQMGTPDMRLPIQYAFTFPERKFNTRIPELDIYSLSNLHFEKPDLDTFKGLQLAFDAGKMGGTSPVVYNAANEIAVELLLNKKIEFLTLYEIIEKALIVFPTQKITSLDDVFTVDKSVREFVRKNFGV